MRKSTPLTFFLFVTLFITPTAAFAHASVLSSNPSEGQAITEMPKEISLTFSDDLLVVADKEINTLKLNHSDGTAIPLQDATVTGNVLTAAVIAGENQPGLYKITYRVISTDGHEVSDVITFSLNTPQGVVVTSEAIEVGTSGAIPMPIALALVIAIAIAGFVLFERRRSSK
jgi:methionine-rich copper-binding protein CopC